MAYEVRSAALNLYRKNSLQKQQADVLKALEGADVVSLSELHGTALLDWARSQGFGVVKSAGDTAIIYDATKFEASNEGSHTLNETEGPTGGMRSREAAFAVLRDKRNGQSFGVIAAHTTPPRQGRPGLRKKIRREQYDSLSQLAKQLGGDDTPVIVAGDLNFKNPKIAGVDRATKGGIMHTFAAGLNPNETTRDHSVNSDHALVTTEFTTGKGKQKEVSLGGDGDALDWEEIEREYGWGYSVFNSDPDLVNLLEKAIKNEWDVAKFRIELRDTKWYKTHSANWRSNSILKATDPATFHENLQDVRDQIENLAGTWGAQLTKKEVNRYAERALMMGWSTEQVLDHIAKDVRPGKSGGYEGQLAGIETQLRDTAFRNGVRINKGQLQGWMRSIVKGDADVSQFQNYVRSMAAESFSAYGREIKAGVDLATIAAPYINSMAEILELNPNEINLFDSTIRKAMSYRNEKGEAIPMSISSFEDSLRADKRWQYTDSARDTMKGMAVTLGKLWGVLS